jgi:Ca-activated chloride channel family protein
MSGYAGIILALLLIPLIVFADPTGKIKGRVVDKETGQPIPGVSVTIAGMTKGAITDFAGEFIITGLEPGNYKIEAAAAEYSTVEVTAVSVIAGQTTEIVIQMERRTVELKKVIEVTADREKMENAIHSLMPRCTQDAVLQGSQGYYPPAHGGTAIVNGEPFDAMFFKNYGTNPFVDTEDDHFSTFAIDVDDASYIMTRSYLERGYLPPDDAVRTEEFINHFRYNYSPPEAGPFSINVEAAPSKFGKNCQLLRIGICGDIISPENRKPANLVFVIDISGSMGREDRLGLVKKSLRMLVNNLEVNDRVGIVVYGSNGRVLLEPTSVSDKQKILSAIEWLGPAGSTNAEEGLRLGYEMAAKIFEKGKINRIILCSDGVANVGVTKAENLLEWIKSHAEKGITLTTVGFGMGNYNDILMEKLGDKGNGHYAYVDDFAEAKRIFMQNLTGTLQVIARDVKIQVDFNPETVRSYRLLGYENRDVADDKFRDDKEDGGEVGSGHQVTALYEVKFHKKPANKHVGTVYIRYKSPDLESVDEVNYAITTDDFKNDFTGCSVDFKLAAAAAEFAEILGKSYWAKESDLSSVMELAKEVFQMNDAPEIVEFMDLVSKAQQYEDQLARQ